jgi:hypothetical protein
MRRDGDVLTALVNLRERKAGRRPAVEPRATFMAPNEPPAPADATPASPFAAAGEFERALRRFAKELGFDLKSYQGRQAAINAMVRLPQFEHLAPSYGWDRQQASPRNPSLGYQGSPPNQRERSGADDANFGRHGEKPTSPTETASDDSPEGDRRRRLARAAAVAGGVPEYRDR